MSVIKARVGSFEVVDRACELAMTVIVMTRILVEMVDV